MYLQEHTLIVHVPLQILKYFHLPNTVVCLLLKYCEFQRGLLVELDV